MTTINGVNLGLSGSTGTGNFVGSNSPTLISPALGTAVSGLLKNCFTAPSITIYTSGSGTYTTPANAIYLTAECWGGGGGSGGSGTTGSPTNGGNGGDTTFDILTGSGGQGSLAVSTTGSPGATGGAATGGDINIPGLAGGSGFNNSATAYVNAGMGGTSALYPTGATSPPNAANAGHAGSAGIQPGGGASGTAGSSAVASTGGGGAGGYVKKTIPSPAATYSYGVGAAGLAGSAGTGTNFAGAAGGAGQIIITAYFQ